MAELAYDVIAPRGGKARGWCLVLHGLGDRRSGWAPVVPMLGLPEVGFVLVEAPIPYYDGFAWFDLIPETFTTGAVDADNVRASRGLLAGLIARLEGDLRVGPGKLVLMGFSQGGLMVMDAALRADHAFAGVVCISGFIGMIDEFPVGFGSAMKAQRILMTHGTFDRMVPMGWTKRQHERLAALGVPAEWREYAKDHGLDDRRELPDIRAFILRCLPG
jgi:phospholipase/carboxylesterase